MLKEKILLLGNYLLKHSKIAFPVIVIAAVAVTVTFALNAGDARDAKLAAEEASSVEQTTEATPEPVETNVSLTKNENGEMYTLMATYYNAMALGDSDTLTDVCDEITEKDMLRFLEISKYVESYPVLEIYTKPGMEQGSTIAYVYYKVVFSGHEEEFPGYQTHYVCTDEQGKLYLKRGENSEEVNEYIKTVSLQDDVVEFNNRIIVEYNELMAQQPELLKYLNELDSQVSTAVGEGLANQAAANEQQENTGEVTDIETNPEQTQEQDSVNPEQTQEQAPVENVVQYATANTTVNVRSSDSEQADKLGKVAGGTKIQVLEQRLNGWTKVLYETKEGYIKSEFLQLTESAEGAETIGTVTATTNVNVRAAANETAELLGVLAGGDTADLIAKENGWCKIKYSGQVGYVKADYVQ